MREVDGLTSATLKHLREHWWDEAFTAFLQETLQPKAGKRILDVGCGTGTAEIQLSRLRLSQVQLVGVDLLPDRAIAARAAAVGHNMRARFAAADALALPFPDATFDSTFCVAVLQHISDVPRAISEMARVTRPGGRIVAVEPDNAARFFHSSIDEGARAHDAASRLFASLASARGDVSDLAVGPHLPTLFAQHGIEPLTVQLFPVSRAQLGVPPDALWEARHAAVQQAIDRAADEGIKSLARDYLKLLGRYAAAARKAGSHFVEIQNTMLFATVGQREDSAK